MNRDLLNTLLASLLILAIGLLSGYSLGFYRGSQSRFPEIRTVADINPGIATLNINGINQGKLTGTVAGQPLRLISGKDVTEAKAGESIEIAVGLASLQAPQNPTIPINALFMASKRGKLYYSIFDSRGLEIAPQNRVYFETADEAEKAGYKKSAK